MRHRMICIAERADLPPGYEGNRFVAGYYVHATYINEATGETYVFIPSTDGKTAVRKNVKTGFINSNFLEITEGLSNGDVILGFVYGLKDGSKIVLEK